MTIIVEIDGDWTVGIDWHKYSKGVRMGFIAIHFVFMKHKDFMGRVSEGYHRRKLNGEDLKDIDPTESPRR